MVDSEWPQRIDHGVGERRDRAGGAGLARALGAEQVGRGWNAMLVKLGAGKDVGLGHRVIHERTRQELPVLVVHAVFHQHLADALHDAAEGLPFEQHVVDHMAAVVDRDVVQDVDHAGVGVDLDLGHVRAAGKR